MYATEKQNHGSDCSLIVVSLTTDHKEGSSLFRFHFSVANILQSPVSADNRINATPCTTMAWPCFRQQACGGFPNENADHA